MSMDRKNSNIKKQDKRYNANVNNNSNVKSNINSNKNRNNNSGSKKLKSFELRAVDTVVLLYLTYLCTFYLLYMHDLYFDITITRARCFMYGSIAFIAAAILAYAFEMVMHSVFMYDASDSYDKNKGVKKRDGYSMVSLRGMFDYLRAYNENDISFYRKPWFYAVLFIVSQGTAAFINAAAATKDDKIYLGLKYAMNGERGRYMGLTMMLVIFAVFIILSYKVRSIRCIYPVFLVVSLYMFYIAYLQHFGTDYRNWRAQIKASQKTIFMSTIGNMNTFGSYLCIFIAISMAAFIFSKRIPYRIMSGAGILAGGFTIMTAKSDNVYLGTGAAVILFFYIAVRRKRMAEWSLALFITSCGLFIMSILDEKKHGSRGHLNGVAEIVGNPRTMGILLSVSAVIVVIFLILKIGKKDLYIRLQNRWMILGVTAAGVISVIAVFIIGVKSGSELFKFDDNWGIFRGFTWKRSWDAFAKASPVHKIFGFGNETVRDIMLTGYYDEMIEVTGKIYDSCHNILLQRLLTTGVFGLAAFLGLFISSVRYMIRYSEGRAEIIACAAASTAYFTEAMVNPEQPITTPLFYVLLATGVGLARYGKMHK